MSLNYSNRVIINFKHQLLKKLYKFFLENNIITKKQRYGVFGVSVAALQREVVDALNNPHVTFVGRGIDIEERPFIAHNEKYLNKYCKSVDKRMIIVNTGYPNYTNTTENADFVFLDNSWCIPAKITNKDKNADGVFISLSYALNISIKLSVLFLSNRKLARQIQNQVTTLTSGVSGSELNKLMDTLNCNTINSDYRKMRIIVRRKKKKIESIVNDFNKKYESQMVVNLEDTYKNIYILSKDNNYQDTKKFYDFFQRKGYFKTFVHESSSNRIYHPFNYSQNYQKIIVIDMWKCLDLKTLTINYPGTEKNFDYHFKNVISSNFKSH